MVKIAIITATRAEYGILRPLILRLKEDAAFETQLYVTGTHLSEGYGNTQNEIIADGIDIFCKVPILEAGNSSYEISMTMANAIRGFADAFRVERPDAVIVLGDRTEILGVCCAAMNERIPIVHLHGGELTEGAVDDCVRHAITKMSYLHFPATEVYRQRIIQMGEDPARVFHVGALGVENIKNVPLMGQQELRRELGLPEQRDYVVVTFHPVTLEEETAAQQTEWLIEAMRGEAQYDYLITKANADAGGQIVNERLERFAQEAENVRLVSSLGMVRYLSAVKYCRFVLGNSSSGIIEAPALGIPTVNIGDRQKGRLMANTVITCENSVQSIRSAMAEAARMEHRISDLYGDGHTSEKIADILKRFFVDRTIDLKKHFYDISVKQGEIQ